MTKRIILFISVLLLLQTSSFSQANRNGRKQAEQIKTNPEYFWGDSGECNNGRKADEKAVEELLKNIANDNSLDPIYFADGGDKDEQRNKILHTYIDVLKKMAGNIVIDDADGNARILRYIKRSDFNSICGLRENSARDYIAQGIAAEEQLQLGVALRSYYWAMMLCHSHPFGNALLYGDSESGLYCPTYKWIMRRTETLLSDIVVVPRKQEKADNNEFIFVVNLYGNGVNGIEFEYYNGSGTSVTSVENGICTVKLLHHDVDEVFFVIDIENRDAAKYYDPEVYSIMCTLDEQIEIPEAKKKVDINKAKKVKDISEMKTYSQSYMETIEKSESFLESVAAPEQPYTKLTKSIEKAITNLNAESVRSLFTNDGYQMFQSMLATSNCKIIATPSYKFLEFNDIVLCRSIPLRFDFNGNASFIRNLCLRINKDSGLVESIAFQLTDIAESDILSKDKWSQEAKLTLLNFLEDYQTAYALKRREYLNQIFSDNALIIIGSVFRESKKSDIISMKDEVKVKYDTLSKPQFINRLNRIFDNNEFVNLKLSDTRFNTVNGISNVIGVEVKQEYLSSTYGDIGYLFLMVDLRGDKPVIHVRTWQPKETPVDEKINANSFRFE
ncbi:MAG: hypothetical protein ACI358_01920 [Candidatus Limimorpha sp.]